MLLTILIVATPAISRPPAPVPPPRAASAVQDQDKQADYEKRLAAAGRDVGKLWALSEWCQENGLDAEAKVVLQKIITIDPDHEGAHRALRHHNYDGKWFESYAAMSKYRREQAAEMAAKGLGRLGDDWVPLADIPFLKLGWVKGDDGQWVSKRKLEARVQEAKYAAEGWQQQDLTWISPDDFDKWRSGLLKCGDEWLGMEDANAYHSKMGQWWTLPGERFIVYSTCDRATSESAVWHADSTFDDLARIFGLQPDDKPRLAVLSSIAQYNEFAAGSQESQRPPADLDGYASCHYAFYADAWFEMAGGEPEYMSGGACYWDTSDPNLAAFGRLASKHAAAQSYVEAIDPSWNAISAAIASQGQDFQTAAFWAEKKIPRWLRYGAASYVERFFADPSVGEGGDPFQMRAWAIGNIRNQGGLRELDEVFRFRLDPADPSGKLIAEAGLLVSFMLDGDCTPVENAHRRFKSCLRSGQGLAESIEFLQTTLEANKAALLAFAQM